MTNYIYFGSDNNSGVHPQILSAINSINKYALPSYGEDRFTQSAINKFREHFGQGIEVFFVTNGTAANVLGLSAIADSYNSIICSEVAHIYIDECNAIQRFVGCNIVSLPTQDGKITIDQIKNIRSDLGDPHRAQLKVISITQPTEFGTVYSLTETKRIADFAHANQLLLHMDGARLSNAAAHYNISLREMTTDVGVDVLSFGGTKNGMMFGDAIIFFNKHLSKNFKYIQKQGMQLLSKLRYISIQFEELLANQLWLKNANHANEMAKMLANQLVKIPEIELTQKVETNFVFAKFPPELITQLQKNYYFFVWDEKKSVVRLMTSFMTSIEEVNNFIKDIKSLI